MDQLWGIGGVVVGILATASGNWWNERQKFKRELSKERIARERAVSVKLLDSVDSELAALGAFGDEHGVFPGDMGRDPSDSPARVMLTKVYFNCQPRVHARAVALVDAVDAWAWRGGPKESVQKSRLEFVEVVRKQH